ncbi:hypothetical protein CVD28_02710 [Bacillus sp. M6-12]|uniref:hypothetical protein n=1 Tax=Bacillus sp. M6-12 TaxID=2054166 RepID=UPI000C77CEAC|nr:hypothetical protein [Bacillus sp. M6-12]PLS19343.1 hypothetical protein CVD28_02710 [Bacillus sp. M6-12]
MKQINETVKFIEEKILEITGGLPIAVVEQVRETDAIVIYEGKHLYAISNQKLEGGSVVSVSGTSQVPAKAETIEMGLLPFNHNAVVVEAVLDPKQAEFIKTILIAKNYIQLI